MANFKLSEDYNSLFSPIHSDISLNDASAFSFGSVTGTSDSDGGCKIFGTRFSDVEPAVDALSKSVTKQCSSTLNTMLSDIKKHSDINIEKEEKFKATCEQLRQSMDGLFSNEDTCENILSPVLNNVEFEKMLDTEDGKYESKEGNNKDKHSLFHNDKDTKNIKSPILKNMEFEKMRWAEDKDYEPKEKKDKEKLSCPGKIDVSAFSFETPQTLKCENKPKEHVVKTNREKKNYPPIKNVAQSKDLVKKSGKSSLDNGIGDKKRDKIVKIQKAGDTKTVSSQKCVSSGTNLLGASTKTAKGKAENLQQKYNKQSAASVPVANLENKGLSLERSIQIAVSMEFDKIRGLMLDQNMALHKEMFKIQDMARQQNEATGYLFSVIEELLEANKKLISKCN